MSFYKRKSDYSINNRDCYTKKCDVRLTNDQDTKLSKLANQNGVSRGEVMRKALDDFWRFNNEEE